MKIDDNPQIKDDFRMPLTNEGFEILCQRLCKEPKIRFCGIVNSLGRIITGDFKEGVQPIDNEGLRRMLYIQSTLELSMKGEFDDYLGSINHITTYRDNVAIIIIPMLQKCHLLMSVERNADIGEIVKKVTSIFDCNGILSEKSSFVSANDTSILFSECS
ncbi:MAG TPA: hypothetical protein VMW55_05445 [Nitrosopumilaceae archaeon]|nr:hypothetical protein [Nitrosopumilaceae archaeon]